MKTVQDLLEVLILDKIDATTYSGISKSIGSPIVFGGQVLAQAVNAAYQTIPNDRFLHSLHSYFLEAGKLDVPIVFQVDVLRDGGSFSTRRVTAIQGETVIFILAASFHKLEKGYEHQFNIKKDIKQPEALLSWTELAEQFGAFLPKKAKEFLLIERPIDFKPVHPNNPLEKKDLPPFDDMWFKLKGDSDNLSTQLKHQILTYISDYNILRAALNPNASKAHFGNVQTASLDHSMWFFREIDFSDWLLFSLDSPSAYNARGFARGNIFNRDGELVASVTQEGLMRPMKSKS
jgi:acyl-CoA thioesterase-2